MNEKLVRSCNEAVAVFGKLKLDEYKELRAKLEWCIGSYEYDNNPSGLIETGEMALNALKEFKTKNPRKVSKKTIENLEKVISGYSQN
ncbi:MAG: iron-containing alcohol dehydrogenase [Chlorobi bacterium]|nr:iron-containing alcohol dehydrogenase [Chlorobiota bacterium]